MGQDGFSEVTSESWFSRIAGAFKGILVGLALFAVSFVLLFWNEGRAVKTYRALQEGSAAVIDVAADRIESSNDGRLVHVSGKAVTSAQLKDPVFQISAKALKLARVVEMYQWKESSSRSTEKKLGGGEETRTTYTYSKEWAGRTIDSSGFKQAADHQNPVAFPSESTEWLADPVTIGAFTLTPAQVGRIGNALSLPVEAMPSEAVTLKEPVTVAGAGYYIGKDPAAPQIGDVRVSFKVTNPGDVSIVAKQTGNSFAPYVTRNGKPIDLLENGTASAAGMFKSARNSNKTLTLILRVVGFVLMFIGLNLMLKPLSVLADVLPFLGSVVSVGTGIISFLASLLLTCITISIAWIVYRPVVGICLLVVGGGLAYLIRNRLQATKPAQTA